MSDVLTTIATSLPTAAGAVATIYGVAKPFLIKILGPAADEFGELGRDYVKGFRAKNAAARLVGAEKLLTDAGIDPQPIPPKILIPLLESASLEDDEFLQKTWTNLLANAANPDKSGGIEPSFVEIMKQLTPVQVQILTALFPESRRGTNPTKASFLMETSYIKEVVMADGVTEEQFDIAFDNLVRLRLCTASGMISMIRATKEMMDNQQSNASGLAMATGHGTANIGPTRLGIAFLEACSAPNGPKPPTS